MDPYTLEFMVKERLKDLRNQFRKNADRAGVDHYRTIKQKTKKAVPGHMGLPERLLQRFFLRKGMGPAQAPGCNEPTSAGKISPPYD